MAKSPDAFRTISEVADWLGVQAHVLRFWESKFSQVKPVKRAGGRRYYRPTDMQLLGGIKKLLHDDGLTIKGVQKILREQGTGHVSEFSQPLEDGGDTAAAEPEKTVLKFRGARAAEKEIEDATELAEPETQPEQSPAVAAEPEPDVRSAPEPETPPEPEPAAEPEDAEPEQPELPSFMHRPAAGRTTPQEPKSEPPQRRAQVVDAPDPPRESDIPYTPGIMAHLAKIDRLSPEQVSDIAPVVSDLRDWLASAAGPGAA